MSNTNILVGPKRTDASREWLLQHHNVPLHPTKSCVRPQQHPADLSIYINTFADPWSEKLRLISVWSCFSHKDAEETTVLLHGRETKCHDLI